MRKNICIWLIALLYISVFSDITTYAEETPIKDAPNLGVPSNISNYGDGSIENGRISIQSTYFLMDGTCFIDKISSTQVSVGGKTTSYKSIDTVAVKLYLQRWDSSTGFWKDAIYVGEFKDINTSTVYGSKRVNVPSNYYYRTKAIHWVNSGGNIEQNSCYSSYIYVN